MPGPTRAVDLGRVLESVRDLLQLKASSRKVDARARCRSGAAAGDRRPRRADRRVPEPDRQRASSTRGPRRSVTVGGAAARRRPARDRRQRRGRRHPADASAAPDRALLPGRQRPLAPARRHRPRPRHRQARGQPPSRPARHPEHAGQGLDLYSDPADCRALKVSDCNSRPDGTFPPVIPAPAAPVTELSLSRHTRDMSAFYARPCFRRRAPREFHQDHAGLGRAGGGHLDGGLRGRHVRRRHDLPVSRLCQVGGRLQEGDRHRPELPVDRLGRRHQADQGQDRDLRRLRRAADGQGTRRVRPRPVPDGDGRHRAGREPRGRRSRAS